MSHFRVLVITENNSEAELTKALQPYHEYECTGIKDEYVVWVDKTEEVVEQYRTGTYDGVILADGTKVKWNDARCYREVTPEEKKEIGPLGGMGTGHGYHWDSRDWGDGRGYRTKIHDVEGLEECKIPLSEIYESVTEYGKKYYGYKLKTEITERGTVNEFGMWTNPNAKWDWWVVGGRWTNELPLREDDPSYCDETSKVNSLPVKRLDIAKASAFAIVPASGEWIERGKMGWWAVVTDEQSEDEWKAILQNVLEEANPDHFVTMVDCHI